MDRQGELQTLFEELLGSSNVYYQPPENLKMKYPAISYYKTTITVRRANNAGYIIQPCFRVVVIDHKPDNAVIEKLMHLPYCNYETHYVADNLHHDALILY